MQVSFNPKISAYMSPSFSAKKKDEKTYVPPTKEQITTARTKKAVSECACIVAGLCILYFGMKRNIKINNIKKMEAKLQKLAKQKILTPELIKTL